MHLLFGAENVLNAAREKMLDKIAQPETVKWRWDRQTHSQGPERYDREEDSLTGARAL